MPDRIPVEQVLGSVVRLQRHRPLQVAHIEPDALRGVVARVVQVCKRSQIPVGSHLVCAFEIHAVIGACADLPRIIKLRRPGKAHWSYAICGAVRASLEGDQRMVVRKVWRRVLLKMLRSETGVGGIFELVAIRPSPMDGNVKKKITLRAEIAALSECEVAHVPRVVHSGKVCAYGQRSARQGEHFPIRSNAAVDTAIAGCASFGDVLIAKSAVEAGL